MLLDMEHEPAPHSYVIRSARAEDAEAAVGLLRQLWPGPGVDEGAMRAFFLWVLASPMHRVLCMADGDDRPVALGTLAVAQNLWQAGHAAGRIDELVVDGAHRGRGLGRRLLGQLCDEARAMGCRAVELESAGHREAAHRFYLREGFEERGTKVFGRGL